MTDLVRTATRTLPSGARCFEIRLAAPRANALEPRLMAEIVAAFDALDASGATACLIAGGRNFSTGGDVARFHAAARHGEAEVYADRVVPKLQDFVRRMLQSPVIFAIAVRGAVTGGAAGFLFAADLGVAAPDAFVQPYYTTVGFAPDGGWTALLPERIGAGPAARWLLDDRRLGAASLLEAGLIDGIADDPEAAALDRLGRLEMDAAADAKALIWDQERVALVARRLENETAAFRARIGRTETLARMERFLGVEASQVDV